MILREHVTIMLAGGAQEVHTYAEVTPLRTDETSELDRTPESINYRVVLLPLDQIDTPTAADEIEWRGSTYQIIGPPMRYTANNALHHLELFITKTTG